MNKIIFSLIMISQTFWLQASEKTNTTNVSEKIVSEYKKHLKEYKANGSDINYAKQIEHKTALFKLLNEYPSLWNVQNNNDYNFKDKCIANTVRGREFYGNTNNIISQKHLRQNLYLLWKLDPENEYITVVENVSESVDGKQRYVVRDVIHKSKLNSKS